MIDALRAIAAAEMSQDTAHDLAHLDRVWVNCQRIAEGEGVPLDTRLTAAAYLHDLVNLPKTHQDRGMASRLAAIAAEPHLKNLGVDADDILAIQHAIEAHSFSAGIEPLTVHAQILRDADRLDALGAIGIARTFAVAGSVGQTLYDASDPFAQFRPLDDRTYSLDHWQVKLLRLGNGLCTKTAQRIAHERLGRMRVFLANLSDEIGAALPIGLG